MNTVTLDILVNELASEMVGHRFGRVFQISRSEFAFDLRLDSSRYLYINILPGGPSIYLIRRRLRDLEKGSGNPSPFALMLKKHLSGAVLQSVERDEGERIVRFSFKADDEIGERRIYALIAQLTGKSANLFLINNAGVILDRVRETLGDGQAIGENYLPPAGRPGAAVKERSGPEDLAAATAAGSPSEAIEELYAELAAKKKIDELAGSALRRVAAELDQRHKLIRKLNADLVGHGDADEWKRRGDLLLANVATARREVGKFVVIDFFDDGLTEVSIAADEDQSITEAAESYFRRYTKSRNAANETSKRLERLSAELNELNQRMQKTREAIEQEDTAYLEAFNVRPEAGPRKSVTRQKVNEFDSSVRKFRSSDGFEILVGKKAKDNDVLTFKLTRSLDTWMHAADYPGSHVVVRNPNRVEIPQATLFEAAQLAAFYSQGKAQVKAAVHYTQKKFVNKPKGAAPGLVSLASFKTILVTPEFPASVERT